MTITKANYDQFVKRNFPLENIEEPTYGATATVPAPAEIESVDIPQKKPAGKFWNSLGGIAKAVTRPEVMANIAMPLLGIAEVIATKGRSQGDYALRSQDAINKNIRDKDEREQSARDKALNRQLTKAQLDTAMRGIDKAYTEKSAREKTSKLAMTMDYGKLTGEDIGEDANQWAREYYSANPEQLKGLMEAVSKGQGSKGVTIALETALNTQEAIQGLNASIDDLAMNYGVPASVAESMKKMNVFGNRLNLQKEISKIRTGAETVRAQTGPKVQQKIALTDPEAAAEAEKVKRKKQAELQVAPAPSYSDLQKDKESEGKEEQKVSDFRQLTNVIDEISNDPYLRTGLDPRRMLAMVPGTNEYTSTERINYLKNNLAVLARGKLKGQGQVSDFEGKMLRDATTMLSTNLKKSDFDREMKRLSDYFINGVVPKDLEDEYRQAALADRKTKSAMPGTMPTNRGNAAPATKTNNIPTVTNDAEYDAIPSGAQFKDPQGNIRRKP